MEKRKRPSSLELGLTSILCLLLGCSSKTSLSTAGTSGTAGTAGSAGAAGLVGSGGTGGSTAVRMDGGEPADASLGGSPSGGATTGSGGATSSGGIAVTGGTFVTGSGGVSAKGGSTATGGTVASGGVPGTGGISVGGTGGTACSNVAPCGGEVVGTWTVSSACLNVSGPLDLSMVGIGCTHGDVLSGSLHVSGTWTAKSDGTYLDETTTSGTEQITLPASCLEVSGTTTTCTRLTVVLQAVGYETATCKSAAGGGCDCTATVLQTGGIGLLSTDPQTSGTYTASGNVITIDSASKYRYCVSGNSMTWTPQSTTQTIAGSIVFQPGGGTGSGGVVATGGTRPTGGAGGRGGITGSGGATGGTRPSGGAGGTGGVLAIDGATTWPLGPCDIYAANGGPCVAAHSTVRRLLSTYSGPLYQVWAGGSSSGTGGATVRTGGTRVDIGSLADGFADGAAQDVACGQSTCTISVIYDQSGFGNHLTRAPAGQNKKTPDDEADAKALPVTIAGHSVYGVHITPGVGYRNNLATGTATGDDPETIYMVASANYYNGGCCFDYGNAESDNADKGEGAVEAVYFGNCTIWNKGAGDGPWVMADLENGLWAGDQSPYESNQPIPSSWKYVSGMVKGGLAGTDHWTIKVGNAESGPLSTPFDGRRPGSRYVTMRKDGAIILGIAGDNTATGRGDFFEGVMTARYASDAADDAVQANIVATYQQ